MKDIIYLSFDDVLKYYCDTIEQSGGGMSGIREKSGIEMILDLVQKTLSKILCKWKQDSVISSFLYLDSVFKDKHKLVHNQAPV